MAHTYELLKNSLVELPNFKLRLLYRRSEILHHSYNYIYVYVSRSALCRRHSSFNLNLEDQY